MRDLRDYIRLILEESVLPSNLKIAPSPINGVGVFATENIPAGTNLGVAHIKTGDGYDITDLGMNHNHSYKPNCVNKLKNGVRYLYNNKELFPGEEITVDYTKQPDLEQPKPGWE